jgi:hypothetical protein
VGAMMVCRRGRVNTVVMKFVVVVSRLNEREEVVV